MTTTAEVRAGPQTLGRWVVPLLALAVFINYVDRGTLPTAAPLIKDELHLSSWQLGILISAFFWTYTPGQVLAGWLGEKINPYRTLALGLAIWATATALMGVASGFAAILALRLMLGLGETAAFPCSSKIIAQHVPPHRLGGANAQISMGLALGPAFGTLVGGLMMASLGWRSGFLLVGLTSLLWLIPWLTVTRGAGAEPHTHADDGPAPVVPSFLAILKRRELWGASLGHFSGNYGFYFVVSWLPLYLVKSQGYSISLMAGVGAAIYVTYAVAAFVSGQATDLWMSRGATPNRARKTVAAGSHVVGAAGLLIAAIGTPAVALGALFVVSAAFGALSPNVFAIGQTLAGPRVAGKWVGVQNGFGNIAGILGPLATGFMVDKTGNFTLALITTAGVSLLGVIGWGMIIPKIRPVDWTATEA